MLNTVSVRNPNLKLGFQTHLKKVSENCTLGYDFRQCQKSKLFGNLTVIESLKSILVQISDTHCTQVVKKLTKTITGS